MNARFGLIVVVIVFVFGVTGCKSTEDKVCDHLVNTVKIDDGKYTTEECAKDIEKLEKEYKNPDDVLNCALEASSEEEAGLCFLKCDPAEEKK